MEIALPSRMSWSLRQQFLLMTTTEAEKTMTTKTAQAKI